MSLARRARYPLFIAGVEGACAVGLAAFGNWIGAAGFGTVALGAAIVSATIHLTEKHNERKSNGRYRKASEAHRAGAGGSAGDGTGTRARRGALRTGASVSGFIPASAIASGKLHKDLEAAIQRRLGGNVHLVGPFSNANQLVSADSKPAPRPAGEFDGKQADFAAGVVTGTRSFEVDKLGRLLGVAYKAIWTPGENVAKCMVRDDYAMFYSESDRAPREATRPEHSIVDCAHGFYGYYEGSNDYYEHGRVMGVVEAYGETIIGSRGFRASKARIVALHIPSEISVGRRRLIARNYPGVAVFDSFDAMVAEFPPDDAGLGLNPTTDPDFWTRKA